MVNSVLDNKIDSLGMGKVGKQVPLKKKSNTTMTSVQRIDTTAQESEWYNFTKQKNEMDKETKNMEVQVSIDNEMLRFDNF